MADRHPVYAAAPLAVALVADPAVGHAWLEPSALPGFRVGGLAVHLVRAIETIRQYTEGDPPPPDAVLVDAAGYAAQVLGDHDPRTSAFHEQVRARGEGRVDDGHRVLVDSAAGSLAWLEAQDFDLARPVSVFAGTAIALGDYLDTRLVELLVHSDDLAVSVGLDVPAFGDAAWLRVGGVLAATALRRHSSRRVALGWARPDRVPPIGAFDATAT